MTHRRMSVVVAMFILVLGTGLLAQTTNRSGGAVPFAGRNLPAEGTAKAPALALPVQFHRGLRAGDVIARGNRVDANRDGVAEQDECEFNFGVKISLMSGSRTVTVGRGPDCTAVLEDVQDVNVVEPGDVAKPEGVARREGGYVRTVQQLAGRWWNAVFPTVEAQTLWTKKVAYGHVYTYGGGGPVLDGLTAQQGWLVWEYNLQQAKLDIWNTWGYYCMAGTPGCQPPLTIPPMFPYNLGWTPTAASYQDVYAGPGSVVTRLDWSSYKFTGDTFQHGLYERRNGRYNGVGECIGWVVGSYPVSWTTTCDVHFP